jgi:3-hydroxyacyl-CoA dehydrogenase
MRRHVLVAGTGRMGLDVGLYFLRRGWRTTWLSGDPARRDAFALRIEREARRLADAGPAGAGASADADAPAARILLPDEGVSGADVPDLFLEAVVEDLARKRAVFARVAPLLPAGTPLATVSSSILPGDIHPRCLGAHCFFPLEMTRLVEAVRSRTGERREFDALLALLQGAGLQPILQEESNAFAVNRLLLPLQAMAVRALRAGWPAAVVDHASATSLIPFGQLSLMDAVGLDVIAPSVENYCRRLPSDQARRYAELIAALRELLAAGKRGRKNRDGFLTGEPLPWGLEAAPRGSAAALAHDFRTLTVQTCVRAIEAGEIGAGDLDLAFSSLFAGASTLEQERSRARVAAGAP